MADYSRIPACPGRPGLALAGVALATCLWATAAPAQEATPPAATALEDSGSNSETSATIITPLTILGVQLGDSRESVLNRFAGMRWRVREGDMRGLLWAHRADQTVTMRYRPEGGVEHIYLRETLANPERGIRHGAKAAPDCGSGLDGLASDLRALHGEPTSENQIARPYGIEQSWRSGNAVLEVTAYCREQLIAYRWLRQITPTVMDEPESAGALVRNPPSAP